MSTYVHVQTQDVVTCFEVKCLSSLTRTLYFSTQIISSRKKIFAAQVQFPFVAHAMDGNFCALVPILVGDKMSRAHEAALAAQVNGLAGVEEASG